MEKAHNMTEAMAKRSRQHRCPAARKVAHTRARHTNLVLARTQRQQQHKLLQAASLQARLLPPADMAFQDSSLSHHMACHSSRSMATQTRRHQRHNQITVSHNTAPRQQDTSPHNRHILELVPLKQASLA